MGLRDLFRLNESFCKMYFRYNFNYLEPVYDRESIKRKDAKSISFDPYLMYSCREYVLNELKSILDRVVSSDGKRKILPDFTGHSKIMLSLGYNNKISEVSKNSDILEIICKLSCMILSNIFGGSVYDIKVEFCEKKLPSYGKESTYSVIDITFPNIFCSSPAIFSIWLCYLRKALVFVLLCESNQEKYETALKIIKDFDSFDSGREVFRALSCTVRDPFYNDTKLASKYLCQNQRFEFYEFSAKTLDDKDMSNILRSDTWKYSILRSGYKTISTRIYSKDVSVKRAFRDYLVSTGKGDIVEEFRYKMDTEFKGEVM